MTAVITVVCLLSVLLVRHFFTKICIWFLSRKLRSMNVTMGIDVSTCRNYVDYLHPQIKILIRYLVNAGITVYPTHPIISRQVLIDHKWDDMIACISGNVVDFVVIGKFLALMTTAILTMGSGLRES